MKNIYEFYASAKADAVTDFMTINELWDEFNVTHYKTPSMFLRWVKGIVVYPNGDFIQNDDWIAPRYKKKVGDFV